MSEFDIGNPDEIFAAREGARRSFLAHHGWKSAGVHNLKEDGSFRRYYRILGKNGSAVMMDSVPELEAIWASSHKLIDFVAIAPKLKAAGISAAEIYAKDLEQGFCLMEDLGTHSYNKVLSEQDRETELYGLATDVLIRLREDKGLNRLPLHDFFKTGLVTKRDQICTWYYPALTGQIMPKDMQDAYIKAWQKIDVYLPPISMCFQHGDYHVDNLTLLEDRKGIEQCGVFDFQGAVMGPLPYDLVNLLEDARKTLPDWLKSDLKSHYRQGLNAQDDEAFEPWYIALGAMFHCRVIGYFTQVYVRDNKAQYQKHVPRLRHYIQSALTHSMMHPLKEWFKNADFDLEAGLGNFDRAEISSKIKASGL